MSPRPRFLQAAMWCRCCQQDVPGVVSQSDGEFRCARCLAGLPRAERKLPAISEFGQQSPLQQLESWDLDAILESADGLVGEVRHRGANRDPQPAKSWRIDQPHVRSSVRRSAAQSKPFAGLFAWTMISLGLTASVFGGTLLIWSVWGARGDLWPLGIPCALGGQAVLVLGLLLQLETLWRNNRTTRLVVDGLEERVKALQQNLDATAPPPGGSDAPRSFYAKLARGASTESLLADLRGQLDLLATRVGS